VNILASKSVPFRPTTVKVPNLALSCHKTDNCSAIAVFRLYIRECSAITEFILRYIATRKSEMGGHCGQVKEMNC
jgi:hypothetical protein